MNHLTEHIMKNQNSLNAFRACCCQLGARITFIAMLMLFTLGASAGVTKYNSVLQGSQIQTGAQVAIQDDFWPDIAQGGWQSSFVNQKVTNRVILRYTGQEDYHYTTPWQVSATFTIQGFDENHLVMAPVQKTLTIDYSPNTGFTDISLHAFEGMHYVSVTLNSVQSPQFTTLPEDIYFETEIEVERYFAFGQSNAPIINYTTNADNSVTFHWNYVDGAEEYDLEWAHLYSSSGVTQPSDIPTIKYSRVTVSGNSYRKSLAFDDGVLWFRVRAVGRHLSAPEHRKEGGWSSDPSDFITTTNLNEHASWSHSAAYAEEGKVAEGVVFADGSGRARQSVTRSSTEETAIVAETFYDFEGRAVISTMPAPSATREGALKFYENFTLVPGASNGGVDPSTDLFTKTVFHNDQDICTPVFPGIGDDQGAGRYYSPANNTYVNPWDAFIPQAGESNGTDYETYPYARTVYGKDGRVKFSAGAGTELNAGSGHETNFYYAAPMPVKLDRMFGNEAGEAVHYFLQATEDANGQVSLSYLNKSGQVVATSLSGNAPNGIDSIYDPNQFGTIDDDFDPYNTFDEANNRWAITTNFFVEVPGPHDFDYIFNPQSYASFCDAPGGDCQYKVTIAVYDNCDRKIYDTSTDPYDPTSNQVLHNEMTLNAASTQSTPFTINFNAVGTYRIVKFLEVDESAADLAAAQFEDWIRNNANSCVTALSDLVTIYNSNINYFLCDDCETYCTNNPCSTPCGEYPGTANCDDIEEAMAFHLNPGGQYFDNQTATGTPTAPNNNWLDAYVVDLINNDVGTSFNFWAQAGITHPVTNAAITSWADMRNDPSVDWARLDFGYTFTLNNGDEYGSLIEFHPEYCHLEFCRDNESSDLFDMELLSMDFSDAVANGYINSNGTFPAPPAGTDILNGNGSRPADPFFTSPDGLGFLHGFVTNMQNELANDLWQQAVTIIEQDNACAGTTLCLSEKWDLFKSLYVSLKRTYFHSIKEANGCGFVCDENIPMDLIADNCGANGNDVIGFYILYPDVLGLVNDIADATDPGQAAQDFGNVMQSVGCNGVPATATVNPSDYLSSFSCLPTQEVRVFIKDPVNGTIQYISNLGAPRGNYATDNEWEQALTDLIGYYTGIPSFNAALDLSTPSDFEIAITSLAAGPMFNGWEIGLECSTGAQIVFGNDPALAGGYCDNDFVVPSCFCFELSNLEDWFRADDPNATDQEIYTEIAAVFNSNNPGLSPQVDWQEVANWDSSCVTTASPYPNGPSVPYPLVDRAVPSEIVNCAQSPACGDDSDDIAGFYANDEYEEQIQQAIEDFMDAYYDQCLRVDVNNPTAPDRLLISYPDQEYQFTLFYYDQSGNLVRTVPPEGVQLLDATQVQQVQDHRATPTLQATPFISPEHSLVTYYYYNSLNQQVKSYMPDHDPFTDFSGQTVATGLTSTPAAIQLTSATQGWAISSTGEIVETSDGGQTWTANATLLSSGSFNDIYFADQNKGYAIGENGTIYETTNAGVNWTSIASTNFTAVPTEDFFAMEFTDASHGFIAASGGSFYHTVNGGANWNLFDNTTTGTTNDLTALSSNGDYILMLSSSGDVIDIANATQNVFALNALTSITTSTNIKEADLTNAAVAYTINDDEIIKIDIDRSGATPTSTNTVLSYTPSGSTFNSIAFTNANTGYVSGTLGLLIKTTDAGVQWTVLSTSSNANGLNLAINGNAVNILASTGDILLGTAIDCSARVWYDKLGRMVASQHTRQAGFATPGYSYMVYDEQGRVVQGGELYSNTEPTASIINDPTFPDNWSTDRGEVSFTQYDAPLNATINALFGTEGQQELRSRVASTAYVEDYDHNNPLSYDAASHYSYDMVGNVTTYITENKALADIDQDVKRMDYTYDLISGNVHEVAYQAGELDQFIHRYCYDADNRVTSFFTSRDGHIWDQEAKYFYYLHGPLARKEIGDDKVQSSDYAYTINGWLKAVNGNQLNATTDMGQDGLTNLSGVNGHNARDAFGLSLGYFSNDYNSIEGSDAFLHNMETTINSGNAGTELFNGNIRHMATALSDLNGDALDIMTNLYTYDQLQRFKSMSSGLYDPTTGFDNTAIVSYQNYHVNVTYDKMGNILTMNRDMLNSAGSQQAMDAMEYHYDWTDPTQKQGLRRNRLYHVNDNVSGDPFTTDISDQGSYTTPSGGNYGYDALGQLVRDDAEEIADINWNAGNKITDVTRNGTSSKDDLEFHYDAAGQRLYKISKKRSNGALLSEDQWKYTFYVRDAGGNVMAIYERTKADDDSNNEYEDKFKLAELPISGTKRTGVLRTDALITERRYTINGTDAENKHLIAHGSVAVQPTPSLESVGQGSRQKGNRNYELANHLGNVLEVVTDIKRGVDDNADNQVDFYRADVVAYSDYLPFGMQMPGRHGNTGDYRYGFNGMEKDDEVSGSGNAYTTEFRGYDSRLGRWKSLDPLMTKYPHQSAYGAFNNNPLYFVDPEGLEGVPGIDPMKIYNAVSDVFSSLGEGYIHTNNGSSKVYSNGSWSNFNPAETNNLYLSIRTEGVAEYYAFDHATRSSDQGVTMFAGSFAEAEAKMKELYGTAKPAYLFLNIHGEEEMTRQSDGSQVSTGVHSINNDDNLKFDRYDLKKYNKGLLTGVVAQEIDAFYGIVGGVEENGTCVLGACGIGIDELFVDRLEEGYRRKTTNQANLYINIDGTRYANDKNGRPKLDAGPLTYNLEFGWILINSSGSSKLIDKTGRTGNLIYDTSKKRVIYEQKIQ